jgi:hypothetical protein
MLCGRYVNTSLLQAPIALTIRTTFTIANAFRRFTVVEAAGGETTLLRFVGNLTMGPSLAFDCSPGADEPAESRPATRPTTAARSTPGAKRTADLGPKASAG